MTTNISCPDIFSSGYGKLKSLKVLHAVSWSVKLLGSLYSYS